MSLRPALLSLHRWCGLVLAVLLALIAATGALLAFQDELDRQLNRSLMTVAADGPVLPLDVIEARLRADRPGLAVKRWTLPQEAGEALVAQDGTLTLFVDPHDGRLLGTDADLHDAMRTVHRLHTQLLLGPAGRALVGWSAVGLLVLNLSGLVLWWRRKIVRVRAGTSGPVFRFELHQACAIASWLFLTALAVTGVSLHWEGATRALFDGAVTPPPTLAGAGGPALGADALLARARALVPQARPTVLDLQGKATDPARIVFKYPEDHTPAGRTNVYLDRSTGALLQLADLRRATTGFRAAKQWNRELHTGMMFGLPGQAVLALAAFGLLTLAVTGPTIWWVRRRATRRVPAPAAVAAD
ncbi:MAG TPA: PepSY-associated TM helix domain-containing protein [Telluria sp.]|nr:PepSY-associated TM helix domain-containing protein [Telluria sp.]